MSTNTHLYADQQSVPNVENNKALKNPEGNILKCILVVFACKRLLVLCHFLISFFCTSKTQTKRFINLNKISLWVLVLTQTST